MATLPITLVNDSTSTAVYAYITGQALDHDNAVFLLQSDAKTPYYPTSPSSTVQPLTTDCAIRLGPPGASVTATIPHIAGGRIWFSIDQPLNFYLNPGPGLVEPSVANPSDPNAQINWGFCEFTWNDAQLFANISYVDFVSLPISLALVNSAGARQVVTGMPATGLDLVCDGLNVQQNIDNAGWASLIIKGADGRNLRALSPNTGIARNSALFEGYYQSYVDEVFRKYTGSTTFSVDTQAQWASVTGSVNANGILDFGNDLTFARPTAADIFGCSSGPLAPSSNIEKGALIARLAAAFNRSTMLQEAVTPSAGPETYYQNPVTNHYARIVHKANADGKGYAFPFDDVTPTGSGDQSGAVQDGAPQSLTVAVGGSQVGGQGMVKQD